jgi:hypothetical protein
MNIEHATVQHDTAARQSFLKHINGLADQAERYGKLADVLDDPTDKQLWAARARMLMDEQQQRMHKYTRANR